mmetsp:Transcript_36701/g.100959  ORF Transcript_36701/g.100959 Transcript_36701/m.100959 type:complete len:346 (+) Transcript_36701:2-1039(+)
MTRPSHHGFDKVVELQLVVGFHLDLSAVVLSVAHSAHDLRGVVHARAIQKDVASLQLGLLRGVLWPHDEDTLQLAMGATTLVHVLQNVVIVILRGFVVDLQNLLYLDDRGRRLHLHARERQHSPGLPRLHHPRLHAGHHAHRAGGIARPLYGHWDTENQHAVELEGTLCLLDRRHLTKAIVRALVASKPHVQHRVLIRVVAKTPLLHGVVKLLRKGVFRDTEMVGQVAQIEPAHLTRHVRVVGVDARVCPRHPLEAVPKHALTARRTSRACRGAHARRARARAGSRRAVFVYVLRLLLATPLLALTAPLRRLRRSTPLLFLLAIAVAFLATLAIAVAFAVPLTLL